ncbi:small cysteine-rich protein 1-like [Oculina patagonica]
MNCKFYLCMLFIMLGTIAVQGARPGNKQENPMHKYAKRAIDCSGNGKYCGYNDRCAHGYAFCGEDPKTCGYYPMHCCCEY